MAFVSSEITWIRNLLTNFNIRIPFATVYCDNQVAIHIASNPIFHERTKHLEIDLHFVREKVSQGILKLIHVRKYHQLADIFTNALPRNTFLSIISKLGNDNIFLPSWQGSIGSRLLTNFCYSIVILLFYFPFLFLLFLFVSPFIYMCVAGNYKLDSFCNLLATDQYRFWDFFSIFSFFLHVLSFQVITRLITSIEIDESCMR